LNVNDLFPSKYIKSDDLQGQRIPLTIQSVTVEEIADNERKQVMRFLGKQKGMILNKTNGLSLAASFGDDTIRWQGQQIELMAMPTMFQGKQVMGLVCLPIITQQPPQGFAPPQAPQQPQTYQEQDQAQRTQFQQPGPHDARQQPQQHDQPQGFAQSEQAPAIQKGQAQQTMEAVAADIEAAEKAAGISDDLVELPF